MYYSIYYIIIGLILLIIFGGRLYKKWELHKELVRIRWARIGVGGFDNIKGSRVVPYKHGRGENG